MQGFLASHGVKLGTMAIVSLGKFDQAVEAVTESGSGTI